MFMQTGLDGRVVLAHSGRIVTLWRGTSCSTSRCFMLGSLDLSIGPSGSERGFCGDRFMGALISGLALCRSAHQTQFSGLALRRTVYLGMGVY